jgi:hypothetical protein
MGIWVFLDLYMYAMYSLFSRVTLFCGWTDSPAIGRILSYFVDGFSISRFLDWLCSIGRVFPILVICGIFPIVG